jgi:hypothetical protein
VSTHADLECCTFLLAQSCAVIHISMPTVAYAADRKHTSMPHIGISKVYSSHTGQASIVLAGAEAKRYSRAILGVLQRFIPTLVEVNVEEGKDFQDISKISNRWEVAFANPRGTKAASIEARTLASLFASPGGLSDNIGLAMLDVMEENGESAQRRAGTTSHASSMS